MVKTISWNHVAIKLPDGWEVVSEGGSTIRGVIVSAPVEGAKFEVYWKIGGGFDKVHVKYVSRLVKKGYKLVSQGKKQIYGHAGLETDLVKDVEKIYVVSWKCDVTNRVFIAQLDGVRASKQLLNELVYGFNCHPVVNDKVDWRLIGVGVKLSKDYYLVDRVFRVGYSMAYFASRDHRVRVIQYCVPKYVYESIGFDPDKTRLKHLKQLVPRFTMLDTVRKDGYLEHVIRHSLIKYIKYGYLLEKNIQCNKPDYIQYTLVKTSGKKVEEAREIVENVYCVEW